MNNIELTGSAESDQTNGNNTSVASTRVQAQGNPDAPKVYPPDMERLASALSFLDPDCDDYAWKFKRLAPMANTAKTFPECEEDLRKLAISWSRGDLQDTPSVKWVTPGSNGQSGKQIFNSVWARFYNGTYNGKPSTLGTVYFEAKASGWLSPEYQLAAEMGEPE
jgi:hypothetical protein